MGGEIEAGADDSDRDGWRVEGDGGAKGREEDGERADWVRLATSLS